MRPAPRWIRLAWTLEDDALLRSLAGTLPSTAIAERLGRTRASVRCRAKTLGLSLQRDGYSLRELEAVFRFDHRRIWTHWIQAGHLAVEPWDRMGPHDGYHVRRAEIERFVRDCPWLYDAARMRPGHPLTRLAQTLHQRRRYVTRDELARYLGYSDGNRIIRYIRRGLVPHVRRPKGGKHGALLVPVEALPAIREAVEAARADGNRRKLEHAKRLHLIRAERRAAA